MSDYNKQYKEYEDLQNFPEYQENDQNLKSLVTESQILSELNNYTNPALTSSEIQFDEEKMIVNPVKIAQPKYIKKNEIYEENKPIMKGAYQFPDKEKQKVKTTKPIVQKTIVITENDDIDKILQDSTIFGSKMEVPLPTQSTIQNLCESII